MLVGRTSLEVESDSVPIWDVAFGNGSLESLLSAEDAERRSIARRVVKGVPGKLVIGKSFNSSYFDTLASQ